MKKVLVSEGMLRQALMLANAVDRPDSRGSWKPTGRQLNSLRDALRAALEQPVVEPTVKDSLRVHKPTGWAAPKDQYAVPVLFNPYTGEPRDVRDVQSDPQGVLIVPPGQVEMLAAPKAQPVVVGSALPDITSSVVNDMCWKIVEELPDGLSGANLNALKPALYEALKLYPAPQAQPVVEHACIVGAHWNSGGGFDVHSFTQQPPAGTKLYTAPKAQPQLLTDAELSKVLGFEEYTTESTRATLVGIARAIEQAVLKKKGVM